MRLPEVKIGLIIQAKKGMDWIKQMGNRRRVADIEDRLSADCNWILVLTGRENSACEQNLKKNLPVSHVASNLNEAAK